jgi:hypothetical protein
MLYHLGGAPVGGRFTTGNVLFVDSGAALAGDNVGRGQSPDKPCATIDYAVGRCTANNGDVIYVMPGHAETVSAAGGLDLDVAGITIIGIGNGSDQPTVTLDTADTADIDVDAANVTVENLHLIANFADIAVIFDVNADDFTLRNCRFSQAAVDMNALVCVQDALVTASDRITIEGCHAIMYDAANTHFVNFAGTGTGHIIRNNILIGDWGTMAIGGAGIVTYTTVIDNVVYNAATDNDSCINFAATATGICMRNLCAGGAAQANGITATAMALAENYYGVVGEDLNAILEPIAT